MISVRLLRFLFIASGAVLSTASSAHAAEPVLVAPALAQGKLTDAVKARLETRLREVVQKSDLEIIEVSNELERRVVSCGDDSCRAELIARSGAKFLLVPEITLEDRDYRLGLTLYTSSGAQVARIQDTCSLCGLAEALDLMGDLGARVGRKVDVATRAGVIQVRSNPPGANVLVAGELVGTTPLELPLEVGVHELRIELDEYIGLGRSVDVVAGGSATFDFELQRLPPKPAHDRSKLFVGLGWGALAAGVGAAAGGATLMVIDERPITSDCSGTNVDADGSCRWRHATLEGGIGLAVGGAVLIGAGVALLVWGTQQARKQAEPAPLVRLQPAPGGFALEF